MRSDHTTPTNTSGASGGLGYGWLGGKQRATDPSGLLLMGARVYDPTSATFTSLDPVFGGNTTAYAYPQDPINQFDLDGQQLCDSCSGGGASLSGTYTPNYTKPKPKKKTRTPQRNRWVLPQRHPQLGDPHSHSKLEGGIEGGRRKVQTGQGPSWRLQLDPWCRGHRMWRLLHCCICHGW